MLRERKLLETLPYDTWVNLLSFLSPMNLITFEKYVMACDVQPVN